MTKRFRTGFASVLGAAAWGIVASAGVAQTAAGKTDKTAEKKERATVDAPFKDFTLRDMTADKASAGAKVSLASFRGLKVVVLIFMANRCGATWTYEEKIGKMLADYKDKPVAFLAVHSPYEESDKEIIGQFEQRNLVMPILDDKPTQALAAYAEAMVTPLFYILDKDGVLRYKGAFDKFSNDKIAYVRPALNAVLAGKPVAIKSSRALGCAITMRSQTAKK